MAPLYHSRPRIQLVPLEARSEGVRLLRVILQRQTYAAIAKRISTPDLVIAEVTVRFWANEIRKPGRTCREACSAVLGIPFDAWDLPVRTQL